MAAERCERFDVVVVGGGAAGVAAAVASARLGARTALIERYGFLGGAATNAMVLAYDGFCYHRPAMAWAVGGIGRELLDRLAHFGPPAEPIHSVNGNWIVPFNPEAAKAALDELVIEAGVVAWLHAFAIEARLEGGRIAAVTVADHAGRTEIAADAFVDASGEGDLAALAGCPLADASLPPQAASLATRIGGIPAAVVVDASFLAQAASMLPASLPPAAGAERAELRQSGGFVLRLGDNADLWWTGVDVRTDGLTSASLGAAEQGCRAAVWAFIRRLRTLPGCEHATLVASGPQLGIRETRHPLARHMVGEADARAGRRSDTAVARAAWQLERHDTLGRPSVAQIGGEGFFDIPAEALRAVGPDNLWLGGRLVGADRVASSSLRVMGTAFATGQAAGAAAALAGRGEPGYPALRRALTDRGAIL